MSITRLVETIQAMEYDGTNAQEILAAGGPDAATSAGLVLVSESDGQAHLTRTPYPGLTTSTTWNTGDWIRTDAFGVFQPLADGGGLGRYAIYPE